MLVTASPAFRLLDPHSGEGELVDVAACTWNITPYANELEGDRTGYTLRAGLPL